MIEPNINLNKLRILLIDDDETFVSFLQCQLQTIGITTIYTATTQISINAYIDHNKIQSIDIIILDLNMPQIDGIQLLAKLSKINTKIGLIILSGEDNRVLNCAKNIAKYYDLNILDVNNKPVELNALRTSLEIYLTQQDSIKTTTNSENVLYYQPLLSLKSGKISEIECFNNTTNNDTYTYFISAINKIKTLGQNNIKIIFKIPFDNLINEQLPDRLHKIVTDLDFLCQNIIIVIPESDLLETNTVLLEVISRLHIKGFKLALADLGIGLTTEHSLSTLPFDIIKIDTSFIMSAMLDKNLHEILDKCLHRAHTKNIDIIVSGIMDRDNWQAAKSIACHSIQGDYIAKAMPIDDLNNCLSDIQNI